MCVIHMTANKSSLYFKISLSPWGGPRVLCDGEDISTEHSGTKRAPVAPDNRYGVLSPDLANSLIRGTGYQKAYIVLQFGMRLDSDAAATPVKFQSDWQILNINLTPLIPVRRYDNTFRCRTKLNLNSWCGFYSDSIQKDLFWHVTGCIYDMAIPGRFI